LENSAHLYIFYGLTIQKNAEVLKTIEEVGLISCLIDICPLFSMIRNKTSV